MMFKKILALITLTILAAGSLQAAYSPDYEYVGKGVVVAVSSTCRSRTLILDNEMVFEIAPGPSKWMGWTATIYRDVTKDPTSSYVLNLGNYEYPATKQEPYFSASPSLSTSCPM